MTMPLSTKLAALQLLPIICPILTVNEWEKVILTKTKVNDKTIFSLKYNKLYIAQNYG